MVIHTPRLCNDVVFQPPQLEKPNPIVCREIVSNEDEERSWKERTRQETEKVLKDEIVATEATEKIKQELGPVDVQEMLLQLQQPIPRQQEQQQQEPLVIGGITVGARHVTGNTPIPPSAIILAAQKQQQQQTQTHLSQPNPNANSNGNTKAASSKDSTDATDADETYITTLAKSDGRYTSSLTDAEMKKLGLRGTREELDKWVQEMDDLAGVGVPWRLDVVRLRDGGMEFRGIVMEENQASWGRDDGDGKEMQRQGQADNGMERTKDGEAGKEMVDVDARRGEEEAGAVHEGDEVGSEEEYR